MPLPFDIRGLRAAKDKPAWYREQGWAYLKRAVELHQSATYAGGGPGMAADADEYRQTAEAMFRRADELDQHPRVITGEIVTDSGELPAGSL